MINVLINLQATIVIYLIFGFVLKKTGLIDKQASIFLSSFVLDFILPVNIFYSCIKSFTSETIVSCLYILLIAVVIEIVIYLLVKCKIPFFDKDQVKVFRYGMLVSNGGLIGTPVIEGLYGSVGVLYANIFLIPTRVMAYTAGESLFNQKAIKNIKDTFKAMLSNRVIMAMFSGILFALLNIKLPIFFKNALQGVASCLSSISLILVGSMLAEKLHFSKNEDKKIALLCITRQIIAPVVILIIIRFLPLDYIAKASIVLLLGMPIGSTCAIFANKYQSGVSFASKAVFLSTISSIITLVGIMYFIDLLVI